MKILEEFNLRPFEEILKDSYIKNLFEKNEKTINGVTIIFNNSIHASDFIYKKDKNVESELYPSFASVLKPHVTTGNGDCLWNMVSLALCGNETLTRVLKLLTVLCMLLMKLKFIKLLEENYLSTKTPNALALAQINFQEYLRIALDDGEWGNTYHLIAVATVLGKQLYIYSFFKTQDQFRLDVNIGKDQLNKHFKETGNSLIGHHLRYEPLKNDFFPKVNNNILYSFFDGQHFTALIPKEKLDINLFRPVNCVFN